MTRTPVCALSQRAGDGRSLPGLEWTPGVPRAWNGGLDALRRWFSLTRASGPAPEACPVVRTGSARGLLCGLQDAPGRSAHVAVRLRRCGAAGSGLRRRAPSVLGAGRPQPRDITVHRPRVRAPASRSPRQGWGDRILHARPFVGLNGRRRPYRMPSHGTCCSRRLGRRRAAVRTTRERAGSGPDRPKGSSSVLEPGPVGDPTDVPSAPPIRGAGSLAWG